MDHGTLMPDLTDVQPQNSTSCFGLNSSNIKYITSGSSLASVKGCLYPLLEEKDEEMSKCCKSKKKKKQKNQTC